MNLEGINISFYFFLTNFPIFLVKDCPLEKGQIRDEYGNCVCPPGKGKDRNNICVTCRPEIGMRIDLEGNCVCALEKGWSYDEHGNCVCPIQHGYTVEKDECKRNYSFLPLLLNTLFNLLKYNKSNNLH